MNSIALDIETENPGGDPFINSTRIISVQIGDDKSQKVFYADSKESDFKLDKVKSEVDALIDKDYLFTGYYLRWFDVPLLKKFLDVEIPTKHYLDLIDPVDSLPYAMRRKFQSKRLEHVCETLGIKCDHKKKMWERKDALERATQSKIEVGQVIMHAYNEFVQMNGDKKTLFYEYAIGDVISEYQLFGKVTSILNKVDD